MITPPSPRSIGQFGYWDTERFPVTLLNTPRGDVVEWFHRGLISHAGFDAWRAFSDEISDYPMDRIPFEPRRQSSDEELGPLLLVLREAWPTALAERRPASAR